VTDDGITTDVKPVQDSNTDLRIVATDDEIFTDVKLVQE